MAAIAPQAVRSELVARFRAAANPTRAKSQQAYMKTPMAFWGISNGDMRKICGEVFVHHPVTTKEDWLAVAQHLWREADHREEWFAAIEWTGIRAARAWQQADVLPLYEEMITSWLRKAIGWALRQQARFNQAEVLAFVRKHKAVLSGLTRREALKHYPKKVLLELG